MPLLKREQSKEQSTLRGEKSTGWRCCCEPVTAESVTALGAQQLIRFVTNLSGRSDEGKPALLKKNLYGLKEEHLLIEIF